MNYGILKENIASILHLRKFSAIRQFSDGGESIGDFM